MDVDPRTMTDAALPRRIPAAVTDIWASRRGARTRSDSLYLIYCAVLAVLVLAVPAIRGLAQLLAQPDVLALVTSPAASRGVGPAVGLILALAVVGGATRGPAVLSPFHIATLASGPIPRRRVLRRPYLRAALVVLAVALTVAATLAGVLATGGAIGADGIAALIVAGGACGAFTGVAWLFGEALSAWTRRMVAAGLLLGGIGSGGAHVFGTGVGLAASILLLLAGFAALFASTALLDHVRGRTLMEQAVRSSSATMIATSGDLVGATGQFRPVPTAARSWPAIGGGPLALMYARRDAVAWLRTPERTILSLLAAAGGGALLALPTLLGGTVGWMSAGLGVLILWSAAAGLSDGIRHAIATIGAPTLFGQTANQQVALHLIAPMIALIVCAGGGAAAVSTLFAGGGSWVAIPAVLTVPALVVGQAWMAAKGPMPLELATPMPTAQGDFSAVRVALWQADMVLFALAVGLAPLIAAAPGWHVVAVFGALGSSVAAAILAVVAAAVMTSTRLRALEA